ncbi:hypothetical protein AC056_01460 [Acinetobacter genomosp. 33YU]|uniref:DUF2946 family protein n=1 Tax=Acinetobacter genomosp. 33YU TaxID=1675530 RepID=UPI00097F7498|nr:hypothetical protein [Acinetobacter genomosp. 33YU]ONN51561.1 hypothetical protein AC056_01460 [Acinetobacter genomosp. 33YU]
MLNHRTACIFLAIFAWLMQLSVFITPILVKHPELNFGICEQLASVSVMPSISSHQAHEMHHTQASVKHTVHVKSEEHSKLINHIKASDTSANDQHANSLSCKFCLLLGHQFNPVLLSCLLILLSILLYEPVLVALTAYFFKLHQKLYFYLFQNRAPPKIQFAI